MLTNARVFGHVFNPLSVFWCLNDDGSQRCVVAEVHNTYGERHCYLLETDERGGVRTSKEFYVSPFNDLDGEYRMRLPLPDTALALSIVLARDGKAPFVAHGVRSLCAGDDARDRAQCARHPAGSTPSRRADQISRNPAVGQALTHRSPTATSPAGGSAMTTTTLGTEPSAHTNRNRAVAGRRHSAERAQSAGCITGCPRPVPQGGRTFAAACPDAQR